MAHGNGPESHNKRILQREAILCKLTPSDYTFGAIEASCLTKSRAGYDRDSRQLFARAPFWRRNLRCFL
jgi:hypothetical protein